MTQPNQTNQPQGVPIPPDMVPQYQRAMQNHGISPGQQVPQMPAPTKAGITHPGFNPNHGPRQTDPPEFARIQGAIRREGSQQAQQEAPPVRQPAGKGEGLFDDFPPQAGESGLISGGLHEAQERVNGHGTQLDVAAVVERVRSVRVDSLWRDAINRSVLYKPDRWFHLLREDAYQAFVEMIGDDDFLGHVLSDCVAMQDRSWDPKRAAQTVVMLVAHYAVLRPMLHYQDVPDPSTADPNWCQDVADSRRFPSPAPPISTNVGGFPCPVCGKVCKNERGLKLHVRYKHEDGDDEEEDVEDVEEADEAECGEVKQDENAAEDPQ